VTAGGELPRHGDTPPTKLPSCLGDTRGLVGTKSYHEAPSLGTPPKPTLSQQHREAPCSHTLCPGQWGQARALPGTVVTVPLPFGGSTQPCKVHLTAGWHQGLVYPQTWSAETPLAQAARQHGTARHGTAGSPPRPRLGPFKQA